ncbi:MAG: hypothetical protein JNL04_02050 [Rhodospirillaceae bacterium]|nr:hypothetical protein [Rhodospirillaceae bacterium]
MSGAERPVRDVEAGIGSERSVREADRRARKSDAVGLMRRELPQIRAIWRRRETPADRPVRVAVTSAGQHRRGQFRMNVRIFGKHGKRSLEGVQVRRGASEILPGPSIERDVREAATEIEKQRLRFRCCELWQSRKPKGDGSTPPVSVSVS